jgi:hypothetical protein
MVYVKNYKRELEQLAPAAHDAYLGVWLYEISAQLTALQTLYNTFLAHVDTANITALGTANAATYGGTLINTLPENRNPLR